MRLTLGFLLICALALAACGGGEAPTQAPAGGPTLDPNVTPTSSDQVDQILQDSANIPPRGVEGTEETDLEVPLPGTLVASETEDPDAALVFDRIVFTQTGGGATTTVEVRQDGTVSGGGVIKQVSAEEITALDAMLDAMNFFGMQGMFLGPAPDENAYMYTLSVQRGVSARMITAQEGFIPNELKALFARIIDLAAGGPNG